jgi:hypothetical protein
MRTKLLIGIITLLLGLFHWILIIYILISCYLFSFSSPPVVIDFGFSMQIFGPIIIINALFGIFFSIVGILLIKKSKEVIE